MPITVECEGCSKKYRLSEDKAGSVIRCKECGEKIEIPDEDDEVEVRRPVKKKAGKKKQSSGSTGLIIGLAAGGVVLVACLVIGLVMLLGRGGRNPPVAGGVPVAGGEPVAGGTAAPGGAKWKFTVDTPKSSVNWPNQPPAIDGLRGSLDDMLLSSTPSPFAVVGTRGSQDMCRVLNLATGETVGKFSTPRPEFSGREQALHPDGTFIVCAGRFEANKPRTAEIWDVKQGALLTTIPVTSADASLQCLDFGPQGELLSIQLGKFDGKYSTRLTLFNIADGKPIRHLTLLGNYHRNSEGFSANRKYLAIAHGISSPLGIYDLTTGEVAGQIPNGEIGGAAMITGLNFSPDGSQLAVLASSAGMPAVYVIDLATGDRKAQVKFPADEVKLSVRTSTSSTPGLQWLPDASGWLICGDLIVDRDSGRVLWKLETEPNEYNLPNNRLRFPTPAGLWSVDGKDDEGKLALIPAPWTAAKQILAQQADPANLVRPGAAVSLSLDVGEIRFSDKDTALKALNTAFQDRLKADQLTTAEAQPVVLRIKYAEAKGQTLSEFKQDLNPLARPTNPQGNATGRSIESTKATLELSWTDASGGTVYWSHRHEVDPTSVFMRGEITPEGARKQMFETLLKSITGLPMPIYLTADPNGPRLPLIHRVPRW